MKKKIFQIILLIFFAVNFVVAQHHTPIVHNSSMMNPHINNNQRFNLGDPTSFYNASALSGTYLINMQSSTDYGWDWDLPIGTYTHTANGSWCNLYGVSAFGLYYAYLKTNNLSYFTALTNEMNFIAAVAHDSIHTGTDMELLMLYNDLPGVGGTTYKDAAKRKFDALVTLHGSAAGIATYIRDSRHSQGYDNGIIPWDIADYCIAAKMLYDRYGGNYLTYSQDMAEVLYNDSYLATPGYFQPFNPATNQGNDVPSYSNVRYYWYNLGITGLIDAFTISGHHLDKISTLISTLLLAQFNSSSVRGAFASEYGTPVATDDDYQTTAYAVMSLARVNQILYQTNINYADYYLAASLNSDGALNIGGYHYPEVGGESASAIFYGQNPNTVYVNATYTSTSCGGHFWGFDAYNTISNGITGVASGGTVNVAAGTYDEQVVINSKVVTLQGAGNATLIQPSSPSELTALYTYPTGVLPGWVGVKLAPIILVENCTAGVTIQNLGIDGSFITSLPTGANRLAGILYGETGGLISNVTANHIKTTGYADRTYVIDVSSTLSALSVEVANCNIYDYARTGIQVQGAYLTANVHNNVIVGPGYINNNVPNGIVFIHGVGGTASNNTLHNMHYIPDDYLGAGMMIYDPVASGIIFQNNEIYDVDMGVALANNSNNATITLNNIHNCSNTAYHNGAGVWLEDGATNHAITYNSITNNDRGIGLNSAGDDPGTGNYANHNFISGNTVGVGNYSATITNFNATNNWWGNASGPGPVGPGSGDPVTTQVSYTPWTSTGPSQTVTGINNSDLNNPISFGATNTTMTFTTLPPGTNTDITVQQTYSPGSYPTPPSGGGTVSPIYLNISASNLTNYTFDVTITLDVSGIPSFNSSTIVLYFSTVTNSWVAANGTYNASAHTYTFTTNHFTTFGFVNPSSPSSVDGLNIATGSLLASPTKWYPHNGMNSSFTPPLSYDWNYSTSTATFYVVPTGTQGIFASKFYVTWDPTMATLDETPADIKGNYFGSSNIFESREVTSGEFEVNFASANLQNVVPADNLYLAKLKFTILKPGYNPISIIGTDFRSYANNMASPIVITANSGGIYFYLGDFTSAGVTDPTGNGTIDGQDLSAFSSMYWQTSSNAGANWVYKYDIGPTTNGGTYFDMPNSDGVINFEDLVIFAIGYGKYANGQLQQSPIQPKPLVFETGKFVSADNGLIKMPVKVSGNVLDLRGFSMTFNTGNLEYVGVEKQGPLSQGLTFLMGREINGKVQVDGAIVGGDAINKSANVCNIIFRPNGSNPSATFNEVKARNSGNNPIIVQTKDEAAGLALPTTFGLSQNYPNPFNPSTLIKYQVPKTVKVTINIYDVLGKLVTKLVDAEQQAGYYSIEWKAANYASGIYFYRMIAGDFTSVKKMIFVK